MDLEQAALESAEHTVNLYSTASVNAYNARLSELKQRIDTHNASIYALQSDLAVVDMRIDTFNETCADKTYAASLDAAVLP